MTNTKESTLCQACGLCCTGHLFIWVRLNASELEPCQSIGLNVIRDDPRQRGFTQPCPAWQGICTVYTSPYYPRGCRSYQCKLLKEMSEEKISPADALSMIEQAMGMIRELEARLPASPENNFRERLAACAEGGNTDSQIRRNALELLDFYKTVFGVNDIVEKETQD